MGCGTALPTLSIFQTYLHQPTHPGLSLTLADYNPTVLQLVTLPNLLLSWSRFHQSTPGNPPWPQEGDLEITPELLTSFLNSLETLKISLNFISGAWSPEFVECFRNISEFDRSISIDTLSITDTATTPTTHPENPPLLILAAETIYSPFALQSFTSSLISILKTEAISNISTTSTTVNQKSKALVGAKKVYFGVGGSLEDFYEKVREEGGVVEVVREEEEGVRRGVVEVWV